MVTKSWGKGGMESYGLMGRVSAWDKEVLEMDSGNDCATMSVYLMPLNWTLKMVNFMCAFPFFSQKKGDSTSLLTFQILTRKCLCSSNNFIYITLSYTAIA